MYQLFFFFLFQMEEVKKFTTTAKFTQSLVAVLGRCTFDPNFILRSSKSSPFIPLDKSVFNFTAKPSFCKK